MVQFVTGEQEEKRFWDIYSKLAQQTLLDIENYYKTAYQSPELGRIIYEEQAMPIYKVLEKSLFIKAYSQILEGEKTLGSVEAYLKILYAIFGKEAKITITQEPLHLKIDIIAKAQKFLLWITKQNQQVVTKDGKAIMFKQLLAEVTDRELLQILKATTKAGTFVEFTLNENEGTE